MQVGLAALGLKEYGTTVKGKFDQIWRKKNDNPYIAPQDEKFTAVVCNPPHHTTRSQINEEMAAHEPKKAYFVDNSVDDSLIHYKDVVIGLIASSVCHPGALLVFEVSCEIVSKVAELMIKSGMTNVKISLDANDCIRTVEGTFPDEHSLCDCSQTEPYLPRIFFVHILYLK